MKKPWLYVYDTNKDGVITISDAKIWLIWLFFLPGDSFLYFIMAKFPDVARLFEISNDNFHGFLSGFLSAIAWGFAYKILSSIVKGSKRKEIERQQELDKKAVAESVPDLEKVCHQLDKKAVAKSVSDPEKVCHQLDKKAVAESVPDLEKVCHQNNHDRIQALPIVKVEHVIDGDTAIVSSTSDEIKIRLDSIDCPENGQEWGNIATAGLIKLIGGKSVRLETHGTDFYGRTLGTLYLYLQGKGEWQNVNERMVTLGHAWVMRLFYSHLPKSRQQKLNQLERWAKSKRVGMWKTDNPIPPWKWRKQ